jgi:hypothetical protein
MLDKVTSHLKHNVVAYLALFVALGGTGAYAANTVFSSDIVDGEVKTPDLGNSAVSRDKLATDAVIRAKINNNAVDATKVAPDSLGAGNLAANSVTASEAAANSVGTSEIATGGVRLSDLDPAVVGARAYGRVNPLGQLFSSKNAEVRKPPGAGIYCIAAGADPQTTPIIVAAHGVAVGTATAVGAFDPLEGDGSQQSFAVWDVETDVCTVGREWEVRTYRQFVDTVNNEVGVEASDQAFTFVVP